MSLSLSEIDFWIIALILLTVMVIMLLVINSKLLRMEGREQQQAQQFATLQEAQTQARQDQLGRIGEMQNELEKRFGDLRLGIEKQLGSMSEANIKQLAKSNDKIQETLHQRLNEISGQVETRLNKGFEKTTQIFIDVTKRLTLIDEAQKRITELSSNVVSLQEVLSDKRSRGAFGEVQMSALVRNVMPEDSFALQHTLANGTRVDCMLFLPEPTGHIAMDSKFPLESYQRMQTDGISDADRLAAERQFRQDIKKHINDISSKYIIADETADGAIMFIPAEAVFAEIHAHHPELAEESQRKRVWMVSPTTLMAVLNTARAVLKDSATQKQVHLIQEHLVMLAADFDRFQDRMDNLAKHIQQANKDVEEVNTSARKISNRFEKIEKVELEDEPVEMLEQETEQITNHEVDPA